MIRKEENGVVIEYDYPNIVQGIKLSSKIRKGFGSDGIDGDSLLAETIDHMDCLFTKIEFEGNPIEYRDLLKKKSAAKLLIKIADDLIGDLFLSEQKKST